LPRSDLHILFMEISLFSFFNELGLVKCLLLKGAPLLVLAKSIYKC